MLNIINIMTISNKQRSILNAQLNTRSTCVQGLTGISDSVAACLRRNLLWCNNHWYPASDS